MARKVIKVTNEEIERLVKFIQERSVTTKSHNVKFSHDELFEVLADENMNRIRWSMKTQLDEMGIESSFSAEGYTFIMPTSFDVNDKTETIIPETEGKRGETHKTLTDFGKWKYIAPMPIYQRVKLAVDMGFRPYLVGPPGSGKSRMLEEIAAQAGQKTIRKSLSVIGDPGELFGMNHIQVVEGVAQTVYVEGILTKSVREGWMCIFDEVDRMSPAATTAFQQITEEGGMIILETERGIETLKPHKDFRLAFTGNTWGHGVDAGGLHPDAKEQDRAFLSRLGPKMEIKYNHPIEKKLVKPFLPEKVTEALYKEDPANPDKDGIVVAIRRACDITSGNISHHLDFRSIQRFAELYSAWGWHETIWYCIVNEFPVEFRGIVSQIIKSQLGKEFEPSIDAKFIEDNQATVKSAGF